MSCLRSGPPGLNCWVFSVVCTVESFPLFNVLFMFTCFVLGDDVSISKGPFMRTKHLCVLVHIGIKGDFF